MKAKQLNAQSYGVTSSTARRILQSLEKMSSPLAVNFKITVKYRSVTEILSLVENLNFVISTLTGCKKNSIYCFFSTEFCKLIFKLFK